MKKIKLLLLTLCICMGFCAAALAMEIIDDGETETSGQKEVAVGEEFFDVPNVRTEYIISNSNVAQILNDAKSGRKKVKFTNPGYTIIGFVYPDGWQTNGMLLKRVNLLFVVKDENGSTGVNGTPREFYKDDKAPGTGATKQPAARPGQNNTTSQAHQSKVPLKEQPGNRLTEAQLMLKYVNEARAKEGSGPLSLDPELSRCANIRAREIVIRYEHTRPDGSMFYNMLSGYMGLGENIYQSPKTVKEAFDGWMRSPGHRRNILNPRYTYLGLGHYYDPKTQWKNYWVQIFGA